MNPLDPVSEGINSLLQRPASLARLGRAHGGSILVGMFKQRWERGEAVSTRAFLAEHPDEAASKEALVELAFEEFCQLLDAGQSPDPDDFVARFPECKSSLGNLVAAHRYLVENPELIPETTWPSPGERFLGFDIEQELGRGTFACVFLAREVALGNRPVAIKVSHTGAAEGNILGQIAHPNVVPVYSIGQDPGTRLTVVCMPFLGRATLGDVLDHAHAGAQRPRRAQVILEALARVHAAVPAGKKPGTILEKGTFIDGVLDLGRQLAQALDFVHRRKIFHRDLKPSNVLLTPDGTPMLLDFNLSAQAEAPEQLLGGTIPYMSPEQLRATDPEYQGPPCVLAEPADLYSLGVILFQLLTGEHPFGPISQKDRPEELRRKLLERQPGGPLPLRATDPHLDREVVSIINRCLAYDPRDRYGTAAELARDLEKRLSPTRRVMRDLSRSRRFRIGSAFAAMLLAAAAILPMLREPAHVRDGREAVQAFRQGHFALAVEHSNRALAGEPENLRLQFLRAKANHKAGNLEQARSEYVALEKKAPPEYLGAIQANLGYCFNQLPEKRDSMAALYYEKALVSGFGNAAVYNNLAYSYCRIRGNRDFAAPCVAKALALDPALPSAYRIQVSLEMYRLLILKEKEVSPAGLEAVGKAIDLCPPFGELFREAAYIYQRAARQQAALDCARKAVEHGIPFEELKKDLRLGGLRDDPGFAILASIAARPGAVRYFEPLLDPAPDFLP